MNLRNCCICLLKSDTLRGLNSEDDKKTKLVTKLVHLAPEYVRKSKISISLRNNICEPKVPYANTYICFRNGWKYLLYA